MNSIRYFLLVGFLLLAGSTGLLAQGEIDTQRKIFYNNERTFSFSLNSNGFSANFQYAKRIDGFNKRLYSADFSLYKDLKEERITYTSKYVYGKLNHVYALRGGIGNQRELFGKRDKGGIAIRFFYLGGFSIGLIKPIYYDILYSNTNQIKEEKFVYGKHFFGDIMGTSPYFRGLNEISVSPGAFVKSGVSFEYSAKEKKVRALEAGLCFDAYLLEVPIMAVDKNRHFFFAIFLTYRFGKIVGRYADMIPEDEGI